MSLSKQPPVAMYSQAQQDLYAPAQPLPTNPILGEVRRFDGKQAPVGWAFCAGALMSVKENPNLFKLLGSGNGGDGVSTFALPKSRKFMMVIAIAGASPKSPRELAAIFATRPSVNVAAYTAQQNAHSH
jgi:microcystin-dependent protein